MGELIYCRNPIAANPYFLDEVSLNIYSMEELSYFIYHNPYLLNASFMNMDLCNWIGRELNETELSKQLKELIAQNSPLSIFVGKLLGSNGYLSVAEIKKTMEVVSALENKSETECKKIRADRLMEKNKLIDAIYEYESIIDEPKDLSMELLGNTYHNLGVAYARMFFFDQAVHCFESAYLNNKNRGSLKAMFYAIRCMKDESLFQMMLSKYHVPDEVKEMLKDDVTRVSSCEEISRYQDRINHLRADYSDEDAYYAQLGQEVSNWTKEYGYMSRI
ncbi:MAG: hypothetical protein K5853_04530 [Lachnospiraceae bacterium]|nr:hypothetical protein [Lachnospiraceae bacterium]